jgi:hypothetical protein
LTQTLRGALDNQAVDMIEAALGPPHARAALVALYEGSDVLLQGAIDLADSVVAGRVLARIDPHDPLGFDDERLNEAGKRALPLRAARFRVEDAAVKIASAGDHLVNSHLRIAWEVNAATRDELVRCGFDPSEATPRFWSSCEELRKGLRSIRRDRLAVLQSFALNQAFRQFYGDHDVRRCRVYRNEIVHRERPSYAEVPMFGRATRWTQGRFTVTYPPPPGAPIPSIADWVKTVSDAGRATLAYADAVWETALSWLRTCNVWITREGDQVRVQTEPFASVPREMRDPGPFLAS